MAKAAKKSAKKSAARKELTLEVGGVPNADVVGPDGVRVKSQSEISAYAGAIEALNSFDRALGGIPAKKRDGELVALLARWNEARPSVMERFERIKARGD